MGVKRYLILFMISVVLLLPLFSSVSAQDDIDIEINLLGEQPRIRDKSPVMVAGIWHIFKLTFEEQNFQTITLKFYNGSSMPLIGDQDESSYYEWKYNTITQDWTDLKEYDGNSFINKTNCQVTDNSYLFCIGIKDTYPNILDYFVNWTLDIYTDGNKVLTKNVIVEKPSTGLSKTHHDTIPFQIEPFTEVDIVKNNPDIDEYFILGNQGNIPLNITVDYGSYNQIVDVENSGNKLSVGNSYNYYVTLHTNSWPAGIFTIKGTAIGVIPDNLLITTAPITLETSLAISAANLEVSVGHSNYKIQAIPGSNIVFQYEESLEMYEGQKRDIKVYISGDGTSKLDIWGDEINVAILSISGRDQTGTPLTITSTNISEYAVTIQVEALRENKVGEITYELEIGGKYYTYTTEITIDPPREEESGSLNLPTSSIIIGFLIIVVVGYMILTQIRHRKR